MLIKLLWKEELLETSKVIFAGGCAGVNSWIITYPVDVVKTQIQAQHLGESRKQNNTQTNIFKIDRKPSKADFEE